MPRSHKLTCDVKCGRFAWVTLHRVRTDADHPELMHYSRRRLGPYPSERHRPVPFHIGLRLRLHLVVAAGGDAGVDVDVGVDAVDKRKPICVCPILNGVMVDGRRANRTVNIIHLGGRHSPTDANGPGDALSRPDVVRRRGPERPADDARLRCVGVEEARGGKRSFEPTTAECSIDRRNASRRCGDVRRR